MGPESQTFREKGRLSFIYEILNFAEEEN